MSYKVKLHPKVDKFLNKLDNLLERRIRNKLKLLETENPFRYLDFYEKEKCHKFRVGDYRALIDVDTKRKLIFVRVFDDRRRVYKKK